MEISASDVVAFSQARVYLSNLAEQVKAGADKMITRNAGSCVALIDTERLDYYHRMERKHIHLLLADEIGKELDDVVARRGKDAGEAIMTLKRRVWFKL